MQLYAQPAGPRRQPFYSVDSCPTPASAYALQQLLLKAYREVLLEWWDLDQLLLACFGPRQGKRLAAAEDRLEHEVPELIERLTPPELERAARLFCEQTLVGFVWHVLSQEKRILQRLSNHYQDTHIDAAHAKVAGLGWVNPRPKKVAPMEEAPAPCEQCRRQALEQAHTLPLSAPNEPVSQPTVDARQLFLYRVKRTQERRRLKRKRL